MATVKSNLQLELFRLGSLVAVTAVCMLFGRTALAQDTNAAWAAAAQTQGVPTVDPLWTKEGVRCVTGAFIVGTLGAGAFFFGVFCGFISRESRQRLLEFLEDQTTGKIRFLRLTIFWAFGGVVASVFQAAQPSLFAPIQAFVLGATWPSVVTRIMSGNDQPTRLSELASATAGQIPKPKSGGPATAGEAEVLIKS